MSLTVFILGRPGSGKSKVAQFIQEFVSEQGWMAQHIYDYTLLQALFLEEIATNTPIEQRKFRPRGPEASHGFDVTNFQVLDNVLYHMAHGVNTGELAPPGEKKLLLIEFARNMYAEALNKFDVRLLQDAYLLYIDADMEICIERIRQRVGDGSRFSHFVSEEIMRRYYYKDDWLEGHFHEYLKAIQEQGIRTYPEKIDNRGSLKELKEKVRGIVKMRLLRETESMPILSKCIPRAESAK